VGIADWVAELEANNAAFDKLTKNRYDESAARTDLVLKQARLLTDAAYRTITERIDALMTVEAVEAYSDFIRKWNIVIEKYKTTVAQRYGKPTTKTEK